MAQVCDQAVTSGIRRGRSVTEILSELLKAEPAHHQAASSLTFERKEHAQALERAKGDLGGLDHGLEALYIDTLDRRISYAGKEIWLAFHMQNKE